MGHHFPLQVGEGHGVFEDGRCECKGPLGESMSRISQYGDFGGSHYDYGILSMVMGENMSMILGDPIFFTKSVRFDFLKPTVLGYGTPIFKDFHILNCK
jgi:hypothetical protein